MRQPATLATTADGTATAGDPTPEQASIEELRNLLAVACGLIEVDAIDHQENYTAPHPTRKRIAGNALKFVARARAVIARGEKQ